MTKRRRIILALTALTAVSVVVAARCLSYPGGRAYFSPDTLETKSQSEFLLPLRDGVPIYRSRFEIHRWPLVDYLIHKGYWSPRSTSNPTWLFTNHWNPLWRDGNTDLHRNLSWKRTFWMEWSDEHPELARVVWPWVLKALRTDNEDRQDFASQLLWHARFSDSVEEFQLLVANDPDLKQVQFVPPPESSVAPR